jgi:pimeloyl-ACP methyl ester carboxylesterase
MVFLVFTFIFCNVNAQSQFAYSKDSTLISYEVYGSGEQTLVFIHGWSCDSRYWRNQASPFSGEFEVVLIDLAGHGHSGSTRANYTMESFGYDVKAVMDSVQSQDVILMGHSMGGAVIVEAARLMPKRVKGIIGVDTFFDVEFSLSEEKYDMMIDPFKKDFQSNLQPFVSQMFYDDANSEIREWVIADMSAALPFVAISALENLWSQYTTGYAADVFQEINIPVFAVNGDLWPINYEGNKRRISSFEAILVKRADHFLMLNKPDQFNKALKQAIEMIN